ncbi:hypothetical protein CC86DRAFT_158538 [Ophiobolus disseminans]|uniref:Uncharacterized protein n=1 Tax=Ophiobolus disseminans TaxID=1469910 RepID=A0A6A6ZBF0_9PLEO|nr:hypothetical protein CC86DRAFT_158538 [Ophiobolus disseminans]
MCSFDATSDLLSTLRFTARQHASIGPPASGPVILRSACTELHCSPVFVLGTPSTRGLDLRSSGRRRNGPTLHCSMSATGQMPAQDRSTSQEASEEKRWMLDRRKPRRERGDICSTCISATTGSPDGLLTRCPRTTILRDERNTVNKRCNSKGSRTCKKPDGDEGSAVTVVQGYGYSHACAFRPINEHILIPTLLRSLSTTHDSYNLPGIWVPTAAGQDVVACPLRTATRIAVIAAIFPIHTSNSVWVLFTPRFLFILV